MTISLLGVNYRPKKCKFKDNQETEEQLIEKLITSTRHPELKKLLLSKGIELILQEALNSGRMHEASLNHMSEIQGGDSQEINTIKQSYCKRCGNTHGYQKGKCPVWRFRIKSATIESVR